MKFLLLVTFLISASFSVLADSSLYERGLAYFYGDGVEQDYDKALFAFEKGSKMGDLDAMTALGIMYIVGIGLDIDNEKGIEYLNKAANSSHPKAQYYLGAMYYLGIGVPTDFNKAFGWISLSADQDYLFALILLKF